VHRNRFLFNKTNRPTNFLNLFFQETLDVSGSSSAHHQEFSTVHSALVYVIKLVWHIPVPNVQWKTPDDGQRNCAKHVEFLDKNKFGKLVLLLVLLKIKLTVYFKLVYPFIPTGSLAFSQLLWLRIIVEACSGSDLIARHTILYVCMYVWYRQFVRHKAHCNRLVCCCLHQFEYIRAEFNPLKVK